jgi:hypothetical protein
MSVCQVAISLLSGGRCLRVANFRELRLYEVRCIGAYPRRLVMVEALDGGERGTCGAHVDYHGLCVAIKVKNVSTP